MVALPEILTGTKVIFSVASITEKISDFFVPFSERKLFKNKCLGQYSYLRGIAGTVLANI